MWSFRNQNTRKNEKEKGDAVFEQNMGGGGAIDKIKNGGFAILLFF